MEGPEIITMYSLLKWQNTKYLLSVLYHKNAKYSWEQNIYWDYFLEKAMAPHSSTLAWKIPWRSLVGCSPWGQEESDMTERLHFHFSLSCIGEGNGNPLQCSCLENPRDRGAWWAAIYGVAQSRTRLKQLSSSSSSSMYIKKRKIFIIISTSYNSENWIESGWSVVRLDQTRG